MNVSVSSSQFEVASSKTRILLFFKMALPRQINYFYPVLRRLQELDIFVSSPSAKLFTSSLGKNDQNTFKNRNNNLNNLLEIGKLTF